MEYNTLRMEILVDNNPVEQKELKLTGNDAAMAKEIVGFVKPYIKTYVDEEYSALQVLRFYSQLKDGWNWSRPFYYPEKDFVASFQLICE